MKVRIIKLTIALSICLMFLLVACTQKIYEDKLVVLSVSKSYTSGYKYVLQVYSERAATEEYVLLYTNNVYVPNDTIKISN